MGKKLNTLTNLISKLAAQAREGKRTYDSESSDSKRKKKTRFYVEMQGLYQPSTSRNYYHATEISENKSTDGSVTRLCDISDKEEKN